MNKMTFMCLIALFFNLSLTGQTPVSADSTWLSVYNTGKRYQLKNAPFGETKPKKEVIFNMVFSADSIDVKNKNVSDVNARPLTLAEIKIKAKALEPNLASPARITAQEIENEKNNK